MPSCFLSSSLFSRPTRTCARGQILVGVAAGPAAEARQVLHQRDELVLRDAALERDALDLVVLQLPDELGHRRADLVHRRVGDDEVAADDADGDRRLLLVQGRQHRDQPGHVARDERVIGGVELGVADARRRSAAGRSSYIAMP